jgi:F420H(2)-dependent quinone reductase
VSTPASPTQPPSGRQHAPFAVWNRTGNRLVAVLLRSPMHRLASGRLALITVTGRRSGRSYTLPIMYERVEGGIEIPVMWPERKRWWRNLRQQADVRVLLRGRERVGHALAREHDGQVTVEVRLLEGDGEGSASSSSAATRPLS